MKYIFQLKAKEGDNDITPLVILAKNGTEAMKKFIDRRGEYPYASIQILCLGDTYNLIK